MGELIKAAKAQMEAAKKSYNEAVKEEHKQAIEKVKGEIKAKSMILTGNASIGILKGIRIARDAKNGLLEGVGMAAGTIVKGVTQPIKKGFEEA